MIKLFGPQKPRVGLPGHVSLFIGGQLGVGFAAKLVGLLQALIKNMIEFGAEGFGRKVAGLGQAEPDRNLTAGRHLETIVDRGLRSEIFRVHRIFLAMHNIIVEGVLGVSAWVFGAEKALVVGFVFRE